jgi:hypothetical protein
MNFKKANIYRRRPFLKPPRDFRVSMTIRIEIGGRSDTMMIDAEGGPMPPGKKTAETME